MVILKIRGNNADDKVDNNREMENEAYFTAMQDEYGFSKEEAELLKDAYDAFAASEEYSKLDNKEKIAQFFSNMAALVSGYSSESKLFSLMGSNLSKEDATKFFDNLGIDGAKLAEVVNQQHNNCGDNKDFAHECAMYSVMSCDNMIKGMAGLNDNIDDLVGFKGDIYSGSMKLDDIKSDIAGVNIYKRMLECEDGDIFKAFEDYNTEDINESLEFLENYGNGDAEKGLKNIEKKINDSSLGTIYIQHSDMGNGEDKVEKLKEQFLDYLSTESGVSR